MITAIHKGRVTTYRNTKTFQEAQVRSNDATANHLYRRAGVKGWWAAPTRQEAFRRAMIALGLGDQL